MFHLILFISVLDVLIVIIFGITTFDLAPREELAWIWLVVIASALENNTSKKLIVRLG